MTSAIDLSGKVAIVTGGGRGLGRVMTLSLLDAGARVSAAMHIEADMEKLRGEARARGAADRLNAVLADIREPEACTRVVAETKAAFGDAGILVNNAGVGMLLVSQTFTTVPTKFWQVEPAALRQIIDTNFTGAFQMARAAVPAMIAQGWGRIVNVTTSIDTMQRRGFSPYGSSKAAFEAASHAWSGDLEGTGVTVNVLIPGGAADTDILPGGPGSPGRVGADGTLVDPAVMAAPIRWIASDFADGVTGRRFIARDWDDTLPAERGAENSTGPAGFAERG